MNLRSSALITNPLPIAAAWPIWALTVDCGRNAGPTPEKNMATTMASGHRFFAASFLSDIQILLLRAYACSSSLASAAAPEERVARGVAGHDPVACVSFVLLVVMSPPAWAERCCL